MHSEVSTGVTGSGPPDGYLADDAFLHCLLPYAGADGFVAGSVPFLRDGLVRGDRVVAVAGLATRTLLEGELGADVAGIEFVEAAQWYEHPSRTLAAALADADGAVAQGRRLTLLTEPAWTDRDPLEVREWQRTEAIANIAFARTGARIMCPYAVRRLPAGIVADARRTHPVTASGTRRTPTPGYLDPKAYSARCDAEPLDPAPDGVVALPLTVPDLFFVRAYVADQVRPTGMSEDEVQRMLIAVTEIITNAERHGAQPVTLAMWTRPGHLVCEITDEGAWTSDSWFGYVPPPGPGGRLGLWAVRLLCAAVQIRTGPDGTVVRLLFELSGAVDGRHLNPA